MGGLSWLLTSSRLRLLTNTHISYTYFKHTYFIGKVISESTSKVVRKSEKGRNPMGMQ